MAQATGGKVIKLRRLNGNPDVINSQTINRNLEPLRQNTKKLVAQQVYYRKNLFGQSPLIRPEKGPVHQRLGPRHLQLKRLVPLGTNTSSVLPKRRNFHLLQSNNSNGLKVFSSSGQLRKTRSNGIFSAQARLERIRLNHRMNNAPIKLRRLNTQLPPATDLTVHVKNTNFVPSNSSYIPGYQDEAHKFKMVLDPVIQEEIAEIQRANGGSIEGLPLMTRVTPEATNLLITNRFSLL